MATFDRASKKSDSNVKRSSLANSQLSLRKAPAPSPTPQPAPNPDAPIYRDRDENGNPGWWSRLKFDSPRYGVQLKFNADELPDQQEQEADRPNQPAEPESAPPPWAPRSTLPMPHLQRQERTITPIPEQAMAQMRSWSAARSPVSPQPQPEPETNVQAQSDPVPYSRPAWCDRLTFNPQRPSMVQAKLTVGAPNDQYEQEADAVAAQVMAMPEPTQQPNVQKQTIDPPKEEEEVVQTKPIAHTITPLLQREAALEIEEDEIQPKLLGNSAIQREAMPEDEAMQAKPIAGTLQRDAMPEDEEAVQLKPLGNAVLQREAMPEEEELQPKALNGSAIQREAAAEAEEEELQTKRLEAAVVQREALPDEEEAVQTKPLGNAVLQRESVPEEEEAVQPKRLQRFTDGSLQAGSNLETQLSSSRGGGSPLSDEVRSFMEPRFGADLSQVRVHTGASAVQMNKDLSAQAFTHKQDIFFGAGKSPGKNDLTAHELTHVVQQTGGVQARYAQGTLDIQQKEKQASDHTTYFPSTAQNQIQFKSIIGRSPVSSPSAAATLQRKCTTCEAEEAFQIGVEQEAELPNVQRVPAFEREGAVQAKAVSGAVAIARATTPNPLQRGSEAKEQEQEEAITETPEIQMMSASSSADAPGDGEDANVGQSSTPFRLKSDQMGASDGRATNAVVERIGIMPRAMASDLTPKTLSTSPPQLLSRKQTVLDASLMRQQAGDTQSAATTPKHVQSLRQETRNSGNAEPMIQRSSLLDELTDFGEQAGWTIVGELAPELEPLLRKGAGGIFDWIKNLIGSSVDGVFNSLMAPVRSIAGVDNQLTAHFAPLLASLQTAAEQISRNDCTPISEAAAKIEKTAESLITPIIEKLQPLVATIKDFLSGLWDKIGAPIWGWIKDYAADQWAKIQWLGEQIQTLAKWIWKATGGDKMWTWLKNKLGIGEGVEGQDGLLQWVQRKVEAAWDALKAKLEPFQKELTTIGVAVGAVALAVSPAGPVMAIGAAVAGAVQGLRWIAANWGKGNLIVKARGYLEKTLIPSLQGAANRLGAAFKQMAGAIGSALTNFAAGMMRAVGAISGSLLRVATSAIQWIADQVKALADWAQQQLNNLTHWLEEALNKLQTFLEKMLNLFIELGKVVLDVWLLPAFLAKTVWNAIPQCIRDPIIDFIGPIILRQIEIFQALARDNEAWQKTKADVLNIVHLVFTNHDLMGAIKATFNLILRVFNIPPDLLATVIQKAESAWDVVSKDPLAFIKNVVRSIGHGFRLLWNNLGEHLKFGLVGWLSGGLAQNNIILPEDWTDPKQIFGFVLDVMGLTADHMWELLEKRLDNPDAVKKLRRRIGQVTRAIEWIFNAIDTTKSPAENAAGIIAQAKDFGSSILTGIAEWIAGKVSVELAELAAAAAASGGLSEVLDIIRRVYRAILTAVRWARRILDMVNEALSDIGAIASGNIAAAGTELEKIMHLGMPAVIGFLADQVGLGDIGSAIQDVVGKIRETVDTAINSVIDMLKTGIEALVGAVKTGVNAVLEWWRNRRQVGKGEESHTLYFQGGEDSAELFIESTPQHLSQFVNDIKPDPRYQEPTKQTALIEVETNVTELSNLLKERRQAKQAEQTSIVEQKDIAIDSVFGIIVTKLEIIFSGGNDLYGTRQDPIPLSWPGPSSIDYPTLYFGGRLPTNKRPKSQTDMQALYSSNTQDDTSTRVQQYKPHERKTLPDGETIGLTPQFYVSSGTIVGPLTTETTGGGDQLERLILPYGFSGSEDGLDLDHVHEIQFGGLTQNDRVENLWPLKSSINRSKGSRLSRAPVEYPKGVQTTIDVLKKIETDEVRNRQKFFFKIDQIG